MAKKSGLGKGIDTIFLENETESRDNIIVLGIDEISPNRSQPRTEFDPEALMELTESISKHGVLQPILVRPIFAGGYQIVAGERRYRASIHCHRCGIQRVFHNRRTVSNARRKAPYRYRHLLFSVTERRI